MACPLCQVTGDDGRLGLEIRNELFHGLDLRKHHIPTKVQI
jgi:hypothetical protein